MTGLELLKAPEATVGEIADIISAPCPPTIPAHCDGVSCRECWLTWLTGEPIKEKEPPDKRTAPDDAPAYYHPPVKAIREAAERIREGRMEYAAEALTRRSSRTPSPARSRGSSSPANGSCPPLQTASSPPSAARSRP